MSKDFTVRRFAFSELNPEAQQKAIDKTVEWLNIILDADEITEQLKQEFGQIIADGGGNYPSAVEILWDLSYSQGSGVSLQGYLAKEEAFNMKWPSKAAKIIFRHESREVHEQSFSVEYLDADGEEIEGLAGLGFSDQWRDVCNKLKDFGYKEIEYQTSEERAREDLAEREADDGNYVWLKNGTKAPVRGKV